MTDIVHYLYILQNDPDKRHRNRPIRGIPPQIDVIQGPDGIIFCPYLTRT